MQQSTGKWRTVAILFAIACLNYADRTAISSVFPLLQAELHMSDVALGSVGSFFLWSYALGSPFAGRIADRFSRSRVIVVSLFFWSLITLATGFVQGTGQLLVLRVILGFAECAYLPAAIALIADYHSVKTRATAMGIHLAGLNFGLIAGGWLTGYLGDHYGWRISFWILGLAGLLLAAVASKVLADAPREIRSDERTTARVSWLSSVRTLFSIPTYLVILVEAMLVSVGTWMFFNWLPLYFRETYHLSLAGAAFSGMFMLQTAAVSGAVIGGYFSDRVATKHPRNRLLIQSICFFVSAPFLAVLLPQLSYWIVSGSIFLFSFFRATGSASENPMLCEVTPKHMRSTAIGLFNTTNCLAGGIGVFTAGLLKKDFGLAGIFSGVGVIMCIAAFVVWVGFRFFASADLARWEQQQKESLNPLGSSPIAN